MSLNNSSQSLDTIPWVSFSDLSPETQAQVKIRQQLMKYQEEKNSKKINRTPTKTPLRNISNSSFLNTPRTNNQIFNKSLTPKPHLSIIEKKSTSRSSTGIEKQRKTKSHTPHKYYSGTPQSKRRTLELSNADNSELQLEFQQATYLAQENQYNKCMECFFKIVRIHGNSILQNVDFVLNWINCYEILKDYKNVLQCFEFAFVNNVEPIEKVNEKLNNFIHSLILDVEIDKCDELFETASDKIKDMYLLIKEQNSEILRKKVDFSLLDIDLDCKPITEETESETRVMEILVENDSSQLVPTPLTIDLEDENLSNNGTKEEEAPTKVIQIENKVEESIQIEEKPVMRKLEPRKPIHTHNITNGVSFHFFSEETYEQFLESTQ
ncbi:hypothetical protein ABK040_007888 [Willaertia magna]